MKLIHLSDLHIGKNVNGYAMLDDQKTIFTQILTIIQDEAPEAVLLCGDIYDKTTPSAEAMALFDWFLTELAGDGRTVLLISGNHDSAERLTVGARLMEKSRVYMAPVYTGTLQQITLQDQFGPVTFTLLPFLRPAVVRAAWPDETVESTGDAVRVALSHCPAAEPGVRQVLLCHQFVSGASSCDSEEKHIGGLEAVETELFQPFDYVALGHLHNPQKVGRETVRYCGTPLKYSFSEVHAQKSVTVVTLEEKGHIQIRTVPLHPRYDMRRLRGSFAELMEQASNDYVQLTLTDETEIPNAYNRLREKYAHIMILEYDNTRTRAQADFSHVTSEREKSELELFGELFYQQNGRAMSESQQVYMDALLRELKEGEKT